MDIERAQVSVSPVSPQPGPPTPTESSKHDHLISEVEATEGQLGPILRTLYDCEEQDEFLESLSTRIKNHEKEIERMCNKNYQWFIESVSELHKVKSEANKIKRKITEANSIIQDTGYDLMKSADELYHARQVQKNIMATLETLNKCIPVLHEYHKLNEQMKEKNYYSALKTLEQLEHTLLPPVKGYIFSDLLSDQIPQLRQSIQDSSKADLTDFLTNVRNQAVGIGEVAMHQAQRHSTLELSQDVCTPLQQGVDIDPEVCAADLVDFSPVYRCLHIFSVLGKKDEFTKHYRTQRRKQVRLAIKPQGNWKGGINDYKRFFFGIVGFFVVEDTVLHTSQTLVTHQSGGEERDEGLISRPIVHEFWSMASAEVLAVLRTTCNAAKDYHLLLKVKQLVVWFCHTMRGYGFDVDKLYEVLLEIREQYDEILMHAWGDSFRNIFENDDYNQFEVFTDEQYQGMVEIFPYQDSTLAKAPFPKKFPFSAMVYMIYEQLKRFVIHCTDYASKINLSQTEIDECVRKSVNQLLSRTMSMELSSDVLASHPQGCLTGLIHSSSIAIPQLVQIWINANHMERSISSLETFIAKTTKTEGEGITAGKLYGVTAFKESRVVAERKISEKLEAKMTEIMEAASYDFMSKEPVTTQSEFLGDCLRLLTHTFTTLRPLPEHLSGQICLGAIKTLAVKMEELLLSHRNLKISIKGLSGFEFDLNQCKKFVRSSIEGNPGLKLCEEEALKSFAPLSALLNLCVSGEWTLYMNELRQPGPKKYPEVSPQMVHSLLYKVRQAEKKKKKLTIKRPRGKKDEKKRVLLELKEYMHLDGIDGAESSGSGSEYGGGGIPESPLSKPRSATNT